MNKGYSYVLVEVGINSLSLKLQNECLFMHWTHVATAALFNRLRVLHQHDAVKLGAKFGD